MPRHKLTDEEERAFRMIGRVSRRRRARRQEAEEALARQRAAMYAASAARGTGGGAAPSRSYAASAMNVGFFAVARQAMNLFGGGGGGSGRPPVPQSPPLPPRLVIPASPPPPQQGRRRRRKRTGVDTATSPLPQIMPTRDEMATQTERATGFHVGVQRTPVLGVDAQTSPMPRRLREHLERGVQTSPIAVKSLRLPASQGLKTLQQVEIRVVEFFDTNKDRFINKFLPMKDAIEYAVVVADNFLPTSYKRSPQNLSIAVSSLRASVLLAAKSFDRSRYSSGDYPWNIFVYTLPLVITLVAEWVAISSEEIAVWVEKVVIRDNIVRTITDFSYDAYRVLMDMDEKTRETLMTDVNAMHNVADKIIGRKHSSRDTNDPSYAEFLQNVPKDANITIATAAFVAKRQYGIPATTLLRALNESE